MRTPLTVNTINFYLIHLLVCLWPVCDAHLKRLWFWAITVSIFIFGTVSTVIGIILQTNGPVIYLQTNTRSSVDSVSTLLSSSSIVYITWYDCCYFENNDIYDNDETDDIHSQEKYYWTPPTRVQQTATMWLNENWTGLVKCVCFECDIYVYYRNWMIYSCHTLNIIIVFC